MDEKERKTYLWEGVTPGVTHFGPFHFSGLIKWETCTVTVKGTKRKQSLIITIKADGEEIHHEEYFLLEGEERVIEINVSSSSDIDVSGELSTNYFPKAGCQVTVSCSYYRDGQLKEISTSFSTTTKEISCIDNLCLYDDRFWEYCELFIRGFDGMVTGCKLTLIVDGEIYKDGLIEWMELVGNSSYYLRFHIKKRVSIIVSGYVTGGLYIDGGAEITLSGFYL